MVGMFVEVNDSTGSPSPKHGRSALSNGLVYPGKGSFPSSCQKRAAAGVGTWPSASPLLRAPPLQHQRIVRIEVARHSDQPRAPRVAHATAPLARGSDTPATVSMHGGGSGANIAAWLAVDGAEVAADLLVGGEQPGRVPSWLGICRTRHRPSPPPGPTAPVCRPSGSVRRILRQSPATCGGAF